MKLLIICMIGVTMACSCSTKKKAPVDSDIVFKQPEKTDSSKNFFPVTNFIKGQSYTILNGNVNPLLISEKNGKADSTWLKMEEVETILKPFLTPVVDTQNVKHLYTESSFLDESINAFTFSYDASSVLPDSISLRHWDVYVNPESNEVQRIYLVKSAPDGNQLLLTWQADKKWCSIILTNKTQVLETKKLTWTF